MKSTERKTENSSIASWLLEPTPLRIAPLASPSVVSVPNPSVYCASSLAQYVASIVSNNTREPTDEAHK